MRFFVTVGLLFAMSVHILPTVAAAPKCGYCGTVLAVTAEEKFSAKVAQDRIGFCSGLVSELGTYEKEGWHFALLYGGEERGKETWLRNREFRLGLNHCDVVTQWSVNASFNAGQRIFWYDSKPKFNIGDKVEMIDGILTLRASQPSPVRLKSGSGPEK